MHNTKGKNKGFSLVELLIVMAVIAAMAIIAFLAYPRVMAGRNANYEAQIITTAVASAKTIFASGTYNNLNNEVAKRAKFFPDTMYDTSASRITNQFGGLVTVGGTTAPGGRATPQSRHLFVTYRDIPTAVCNRLAPALAQNFESVYVGTGDSPTNMVKNDFMGRNGALNESAVATGCNNANGKANIRIFTR